MLDGFDIDSLMSDFDIESLDGFMVAEEKSPTTRYMKPKIVPAEPAMYEKAIDMALRTTIEPGANLYAIVSGNFIFGDYLEALVYERGVSVKEMHIATLSMSENNVDSLSNIMLSGRCEKLNLIVSHYFYSHERNRLIPYILSELDKDNRFQLAVAGSHCKIVLIKTIDDLRITIHGSANLRSSANMEQVTVTENKKLYDFNRTFFDKVIKQSKIIDKRKALRGDTLWQLVAENSKATTASGVPAPQKKDGANAR